MIRNYNSLLRSSPTSTLVFADVAEQIVFKETVWGLRAGSSFGSVNCQKSCCHTSTCRLTVEERSESAGYSTSLLPKTQKNKKTKALGCALMDSAYRWQSQALPGLIFLKCQCVGCMFLASSPTTLFAYSNYKNIGRKPILDLRYS